MSKTITFLFPEFNKALNFKEKQLKEYKVFYPRTTYNIGVGERSSFYVTFHVSL